MKETLRYWKEKAVEAEQKMMAAKSKQTVKKWSRELQVCGMNIRELERNIKGGKVKNERRKARAKERWEALLRYERATRPGKDARRLKQIRKQEEKKEIKKLKRLVVKAAELREKASSWLDKDFYTCQIRDYNEQIEIKEKM